MLRVQIVLKDHVDMYQCRVTMGMLLTMQSNARAAMRKSAAYQGLAALR
jgi:hypothetical protein